MRLSWLRPAMVAVPLLVSSAGCSIPLADAGLQALNQCESAADCGAGATCVDTGQGSTCVSTSAELSGLLLDIRPTAGPQASGVKGAVQGGAAYLLEPAADGARISGNDLAGVVDYDATLPQLVDIVEGHVNAFAAGDACASKALEAIPAEVFFYRSTLHAGLPVAEYTATTELRETTGHTFSISLPAGKYDVYVRPRSPEDCFESEDVPLAPPPPYSIHSLDIDPGNGQMNIDLPEPRSLEGKLAGSAALDLTDWTIAMVDRVTAKLISTEPVIVKPALVDALYQISYHPSGGAMVEPPYVRVRAPEAQAFTPTVLWKLEDVDLDANGVADLSLDALSKEVEVQATILASDERTGVASTVTFVGSFQKGSNVLFEKTLTTEPDGTFATTLFPSTEELPGLYDVFARPLDDQLAEAIGMESPWQINPTDECYCGHSVVLPLRSQVSAQVHGRGGELMEGLVSAAQSARSSDVVAPRSVDEDLAGGNLSVRLDPGTFDLAIKPYEGSGYPWLVTSQLQISPSQEATALGQLEVPYPVVLRGRVLDASGAAVGNAPITAWLPVIDAATQASIVVQIGQTVSDRDGFYTLYLPPTLAH